MDELLTLGCIALFFALVVVPILAIIALSRSTAVRSELATLRRRVEVLEQRGVTEAPATVVTTVPQSVSQMVVPVETSSPAVNIVLSEPVADVTPESVDPWRPQPKPQNEALPTPAVEQSSAFGGVMSSLVRWFMQGNPLAKLGILLLFLGFSFLLRYTVEHSLFPLELRLVATSLFAIALLVVGWRLRHNADHTGWSYGDALSHRFWRILALADAADDAGVCITGGDLRGERGTGDYAKSAQPRDAGKYRWLSGTAVAFHRRR